MTPTFVAIPLNEAMLTQAYARWTLWNVVFPQDDRDDVMLGLMQYLASKTYGALLVEYDMDRMVFLFTNPVEATLFKLRHG